MMTDHPPANTPLIQLAEAEAMLERLPAYLASDELFKAVTVEGPDGVFHATLTLGNLLQRLDEVRRATFDDPTAAQRAAAVEARHDELRAIHREAYTTKLAKEVRSHENALRAESEDAADDGGKAPGHASAAEHHASAIRRLRRES